ncbi:uncharacterized protein F5891DRAFT_1209378 [Suillus fuscotomentosus]|uniref:Uncharacterized protein n=1 Tax=Suillus fuscotomentosus TaxID=1912939 RepID=A0AAD4DSB9_9AGAM|nr:uncharacterized protein F5891DRAFT_1209378 [Suillus fuscotomentosus]KAG1892982.1 hypothetical protein F5891DRAFT_1209378 [Suillus fuscotomentosus]
MRVVYPLNCLVSKPSISLRVPCHSARTSFVKSPPDNYRTSISAIVDLLARPKSPQHPDYLLVIPLHSESFRPSFKFKGLSSVKFIGIGNFELDDSFLNDVPVAWPGIQELKFISWKRRASYSVTFTAMISLASRCRSLQTLHLTVDATQSTTIPRAPGGTEKLWPTQTTLRNLHLGYSRVSEVAHIPYFLADVFPTLWDFKFYERYVRNCAADIDLRLALEEAYSQLMTLRNSPYDNSDKLWETDSDDSGT